MRHLHCVSWYVGTPTPEEVADMLQLYDTEDDLVKEMQQVELPSLAQQALLLELHSAMQNK